ncbi:MAG: right-handed parallel beta-helix repeat-containing protein [Saprospiraceae bacterium]|nr:right-handed parallel beta-helix repeat-containing protein [Saprospiraceae bacterium]
MMRPSECRYWTLLVLFLFVITSDLRSETYFVGPGETFTSLASVADILVPGDSVIIRNGNYQQRENLIEVKGSIFKNIVIMAETPGQVIYEGGSEAWHLSDCAYLKITGFVFTGQTANGVNIDDAGSFDTPTHDIIIENCTFRDMNANGNNDLLKLSGLDEFRISFCRFINGSAGGSGIDMVGCHNGIIQGNLFENMGSNGIQAKGGTQFITIEQNTFIDAGRRSVNLGGSTGLAYFRPQDAPFEAADLWVRANVFKGSNAAVAYVGSTRVLVENNTIIEPEVWIYRILQETVDTIRFVSCGDNIFRNNLVYVDNGLRRDFNIGPNTRPESFLFENNLWYNHENPAWNGPNNPGIETGKITGMDPQFMDEVNDNYRLMRNSPVIRSGKVLDHTYFDRDGKRYSKTPTIGAFEAGLSADPPFAPIGAEWYYDEHWSSRPYLGYYRLQVVGDTIIDNRMAQIIHYYEGDETGETHIAQATAYVTSEGNTVQVYWGDDFLPLYRFQVFSDPQLAVSPVTNYYYEHSDDWQSRGIVGVIYENRSAGSIPGGLQAYTPYIHSTEDSLCASFGDTIISRIGAIDQGWFPRPCETFRGGVYGRLRCYSDHRITYNPRNISCDSVRISTNVENFLSDRSTMNYDFETQVLNVYMGSYGRLSISDLNGRVLRSLSMSEGDHRIQVNGLYPGIYLARLSIGESQDIVQKFVIQ